MFHCMQRSRFVYPSSIGGHQDSFYLLVVANNAIMEMGQFSGVCAQK